MIIGNKLRRLRKERGWSTHDLAEQAGVSSSLINDLENERDRTVTLSSLKKISDSLNIALVELLPVQSHMGDQSLTTEEKELYHLFHSLNPDQRSALVTFLKTLD
ncbi:helix-turn-helix domain-containing protein [Brevibacillus reuszeri]|uniref:helix-turn-helix domain-containing protein n=1 Tax=Brevibacillus reuszeri TaxID=54915 RepID=UPI000CCC6FBB|nr:helix-turn-helix transcriptional regulator [Brevibacillus reuszeri]